MTAPSEAQSLRDAVARVFHEVIAGLYANQRWYLSPFETPGGAWWRRADELLASTSPIGAHIAKIEAERMPHMCRDGHAEIRYKLSDDDERCPVCRERDAARVEGIGGA